MIKSTVTTMLCAFALGFVSSVSASTINIDFGIRAGEPSSLYAAAGEAGVWNLAGLGTTSDLVGIDNVVSSVSVDVSALADTGTSWPLNPVTDIGKLMGDHFYTLGGSWAVQLDGLTDGLYSIILYAPTNINVSTGLMTINGDLVGELPGTNPASLIEGASYGIYNTVVSDGMLVISGTRSIYSGLAGMQITPSPIPLPAAVWLFGSGLLGLVAAARRRKT